MIISTVHLLKQKLLHLLFVVNLVVVFFRRFSNPVHFSLLLLLTRRETRDGSMLGRGLEGGEGGTREKSMRLRQAHTFLLKTHVRVFLRLFSLLLIAYPKYLKHTCFIMSICKK